MLSYAFTTLNQGGYEDVATEEFENIHNLFAAILAKGIGKQLKQGLYREYLNRKDDITVVRGKIDMPGTIRNRLSRKQVLTCEYDELSENNLFNQILKTTVMLLLRHATIGHCRLGQYKADKALEGHLWALDLSKAAAGLDYAHHKKQHQQSIANGLERAVDADDHVPDPAAFEFLRGGADQGPDLREFVVPGLQGGIQIVYDPVSTAQLLHLLVGAKSISLRFHLAAKITLHSFAPPLPPATAALGCGWVFFYFLVHQPVMRVRISLVKVITIPPAMVSIPLAR